jgi:predicted nucleic acid-binding protein
VSDGGVLDAGVVLARLDPGRRGHAALRRVLVTGDRSRRWLISAVNLAEALQHARDWERATGADLMAVLSAFGVAVHSPDVPTARRVAALADEPDLSLGDRFVLATADRARARLWTTDTEVAAAARRMKLAVTRV